MTDRLYIRDDIGDLWFLENGRIQCVESTDHDDQNGYAAASWEDAIQILNEYGYIGPKLSNGVLSWN